LSFAQAAAAPIGALTASQGLFTRAMLRRDETVLIHGGSGAVGSFAVQFAHAQGAHVFTTASAHNRDFLLRLGADRVIDYRLERFEEIIRGVDVLFDCVGGDTLRRSWQVLAPGGRLITITADSEGADDERIKAAFFIVTPDGHELARIAILLDAGKLEAVVDYEAPMSQAGAAYARAGDRRSGRGKAVVVVVAD
jgi:NADPH:quinone reductase-like Zn-dependent oxidoreductase